MQTFLPYPSLIESAKCLDYKRLGKQRVECCQILNCLKARQNNEKIGWVNHPIVKMWIGHDLALKLYTNIIIEEWIKRGYKNNIALFHLEDQSPIPFPKWLGNKDFHDSHKSNLLRKDPIYYGQFNWNVPDNLPYVWLYES